jgi:hypothetical protein
VPELAELAAPIIHEDAPLIDADIEIQWCQWRLAEENPTPPSRTAEIRQKLNRLLERVAKAEAKTPRGQAIKSRHAPISDHEAPVMSRPQELFRKWLDLREAEDRPGKDDDEIDRLSDERIVAERAILAGSSATPEDERAQIAMLVYYAVHQAPYANWEVLEGWYRRLVTDQISNPAARERERERSAKWVRDAQEHLAALKDEAREDGAA